MLHDCLFLFLKKIFIHLFLAALGLRYFVRAFSSCGEQGLLFIAVHGLLIVGASLVAEHRLSSCGTWVWLLRSMWDLPRPGIEPMFPVLAGRFLSTVLPGKSLNGGTF